MGICTAPPQSNGFIGSVTHFIDCQAQALGSNAWQALSMPGSTLAIVLSGFLTIFIALIGYNLLLGRGFTVRDGTLAAVKVGAVFALATSWPAYRTLVYDLVVDGPSQLVSDIGRPANVPGSDGSLLQRLDAADGALVQLSILGPGNPGFERTDIVPPPFAGFSAFALGGSRILFLITAVGGLGIVRMITGLMLALGPFFIAFFLFDSTRSLFEGWVRVIAGAALGAVGVAIALGLQLAFLEPWLAAILARRTAGEALPAVPTELFVISSVFALAVVAMLFACVSLARAFRLSAILSAVQPFAPSSAGATREQPLPNAASPAADERSRARSMADLLTAAQHRETTGRALAGATRIVPLSAGQPEGRRSTSAPATPLGRSFRRAAPNRSASAGKRDQR